MERPRPSRPERRNRTWSACECRQEQEPRGVRREWSPWERQQRLRNFLQTCARCSRIRQGKPFIAKLGGDVKVADASPRSTSKVPRAKRLAVLPANEALPGPLTFCRIEFHSACGGFAQKGGQAPSVVCTLQKRRQLLGVRPVFGQSRVWHVRTAAVTRASPSTVGRRRVRRTRRCP